MIYDDANVPIGIPKATKKYVAYISLTSKSLL